MHVSAEPAVISIETLQASLRWMRRCSAACRVQLTVDRDDAHRARDSTPANIASWMIASPTSVNVIGNQGRRSAQVSRAVWANA